MRARGFAIATSLYVVFMILMFGMTLATLSGFQYQFAHEATNRGRCFEAAQAGISQAIYNLSSQSSWGTTAETVTASVAADGSSYYVTFDSSLGGPYSTNNLSNSSSVPGYQGQVVPAYSALILAQGRSTAGSGGTQTRTCEALVQYAAYPYAVAASKTVTCSGPLQVSGSSSLQDLLAGTAPAQTANVYGGSSSSSAVQGGALSHVSGKIRTPGGVVLGALSSVVDGIEEGCQAESLPNVDIQTYNNQNFANVTVLSPGGTYSVISGPTYVNGDITLLAGVLDNAYLFVDGGGNLKSELALTGTGSIFVTGSTNLEGVATLMLNSGIAVFSQGDLKVSGGNFFQGVLYSHGTITAAAGVNVVGCMIAQNDNSGGGDIDIGLGANVSYLPEFTQFGSAWSNNNMMGQICNGTTPLMKIFWREMP